MKLIWNSYFWKNDIKTSENIQPFTRKRSWCVKKSVGEKLGRVRETVRGFLTMATSEQL